MKIMTFNLRVAVTTDPYVWEQRRDWAVELIREYNPDLIGTQEANTAMMDWLKERLHDEYDCYGVNRSKRSDNSEYCAIFVKRSRFTILRRGSFMLSETPDSIGSFGWDAHCERICSWVELAAAGESEPVLRLLNTHLDHAGQTAREEGLKLIRARLAELNSDRRLPAVLVGDFNDTPESGLLEVLKGDEPLLSCYDRFTDEERAHALTFHDYKGGEKGSPIDYILFSPDIECHETIIVRDLVQDGYPSDHYPVQSQLFISETSI
ncbi:endonuclease/exonuclease/phosphatase family protein [Paenibacillus pinihumi]|uniref:endonuclease/exonuclease/phosphatase family protein n=1 Tax=Paenibacillus pinihumi TaxID=669462 RepID=UPI0003FFFA4C|nr:endonuclease/exonuclease/phosphatase family protein [Paenibacillus pinihumi]